jgi:diadenosine tetraphosphate (Ap4A) HIT family hydrolase
MDVDVCELCATAGGTVLWESPDCRVVRIDDADYPGYCRVIWNAHVREMSDLEAADRDALMKVVFAVEKTIRSLFAPDKINLASLGNQTPHVHWHVIPRWRDDRHFPGPIWGVSQGVARLTRAAIDDEALRRELAKKLNTDERSDEGK